MSWEPYYPVTPTCLFKPDEIKLSNHRIKVKLELVKAIINAKINPERGILNSWVMECYFYPLPVWEDGEKAKWNVLG